MHRAPSAGADLGPVIAAAVAREMAEVSGEVFRLIVREIPQLDEDKPLAALLASSVDSNVATCLQIMQHQIDLAGLRAPVAAVEYARRLAQRGIPLAVLLRTYRLGHACFADRLFRELAQQGADAETVTATTRSVSTIVADYIDQVSEEMVTAYVQARENWLRNRSAARTARIRDLLAGGPVDVSAAEPALGYRLRQFHVGVVCWADPAGSEDQLARLERSVAVLAAQASCGGEPLTVPRDESSAWAWLPLGIRDQFDAEGASAAVTDAGVHFTFGDAAHGVAGFRLTHQQAVVVEAVALARRSPASRVVTYRQVAPVAMMLRSTDLLRDWVRSTLGGLATDDEHHARLRDTLLVFLRSGGSYKATAEQMVLHKNTVMYRIRRAEESLGRPVGENRHDVELALHASHWLGSSVLRPADAGPA